jgi:carnitine 3-dehydrogenase
MSLIQSPAFCGVETTVALGAWIDSLKFLRQTESVKTFGIVGTGVIGSGWASRALALGYDVVAWDPAPGAEARLRVAVERAWPSLQRLGMSPDASLDRLRFVSTLEEVGSVCDFIQENAPENLELKQSLHAQLSAVTPLHVVIGSSTSGLLPSDMQRDMVGPDRLVVGHPFNPVYLLPLVEVVGGKQTSPDSLAKAMDVYQSLGMHALHVRNEIEGFLTDRLQEALWREILHIVNDGVATTDELDQSIVYGPGLRWAAMGTNLIYHLAGGEAGMRHMLKQFGPALELPWTKLVAPKLNDTLIDRMVEGTQSQAAGRSIAELEAMRDEYLIDVMEALERRGLSAGLTLRHHRELTGTPTAEVFTEELSAEAMRPGEPTIVTDRNGKRYRLEPL